jgi:glyoxylase-like metal-dependent hydrolase (beta-lactamase superfamily II)
VIQLRALTCGWIRADAGMFLAGASGELRVPVPVYLIEHPRGRVLFDSGLHPDLSGDPAARIGGVAKIFRCELGEGEHVAGRLAALDLDVDRIDFLVTSHLHFDHAGGLACVPNARLVVQREEWEAGQDPERAAKSFFDPRDYDLGHDVLAVEGEHDLFGDGAVVCVPTPGHTPGHQSLRVRLPGGEVVLAADACYLRRTLEEGILPPIVHDEAEARRSLDRLRALQRAGARIFYGHDPEFWATLPQSPVLVT